jgi:hypothetical protein
MTTFVNIPTLEYLIQVPVVIPSTSRLQSDIQAVSEEIDLTIARKRRLNPERLDYNRIALFYDTRITQLREQRTQCLDLLNQSGYKE